MTYEKLLQYWEKKFWLTEFSHLGGNGNLKGIVALCKGQKISDVKNRLSGITCGGKSTSCPDQFAQVLAAVDNN